MRSGILVQVERSKLPVRDLRSVARIRPLNRLLVFLSEAGVLVLGLIASSALAFLAGLLTGSYANRAAGLAFYAGLLLTTVAFFVRRRKTRPWKIDYDAASYRIEKTERKLHPVGARLKRTLLRAIIWVPSAIGALAVFFFPIASHSWHFRVHIICDTTASRYRGPQRSSHRMDFGGGRAGSRC